MNRRLIRQLAIGVVAGHAAILYGHDVAHRALGVTLHAWQKAFAYPVMVVAPFVAVILLFGRRSNQGAWLLSLSMLGSLLFGVYHHYVLVSPDHIAHLPAGPEGKQWLFRATALAMAVFELAGVGVGWLGRSKG